MAYQYKTVVISLIFLVFFALAGQTQDNSDEYGKTIEMADSYFTKGDYINAKASYQIAVRLAPAEQYPKDRLQQSLDMIKVQMVQNTLYMQKIQVADNLFEKNDLEAALKVYQEALTLLPSDPYASGRIQEITMNQNDNKLLEEKYQKSIINGDLFLKGLQLENALAEYRNATKLKPSEAYPKEKAAQVEKLITEGKAITGDYENYLQEADLAISRNKYDEAISFLEQAILLKPGERQPMAKLTEARNLKTAWDSYSTIISEADNFYITKDFEKAKEKYLVALSIKPADEYPKRMLEKIDIALMDLSKANRSSYEVVIALADKLFNQQDYEQAMIEYNNALHFKPDEQYAKQRISDINNALSLRNTQEEAYSQAISRADNLFRDEQYEEAREEYTHAIGIKPLEQYPKVKVDEINTVLSNLASRREVYNNLIKGADRLFFSDEYYEAREQYRSASDLFSKEHYPLDQITMINEILGIRDKYVKAVTTADQLLYNKDYEGALLEFRNAAGINPEEAYPLQKIKEIETLMATNAKQQRDIEDEKVSEQEYQEALEAYQQEKIFEIKADSAELAAIEALDNQYRDLISTADNALLAKDYQKASAGYQAALGLKPGESYAQGKITEINAVLGEIAAKEALDKQYADAISTADNALLAKDYQKASAGYQSALNLKPDEAYAHGKVAEINAVLGEIDAKEALDKQYGDVISTADKALLAKDYQKALTDYQTALGLKPGESYAQGKITEINAVLGQIAAKEALENQYRDIISTADKALLAKDYQKALTDYQTALGLKPGESYAQGKVAEINAVLGEIAAKEALDKQYADAISVAENSLKAKDYQKALTDYQAALNLKPGEAYAQGKVAEINAVLGEIAAKEALDKQYADAISVADNSLKAKDYQKALTDYQAALNFKPGEAYAQGKIGEINKILSDIAAKEALDKQYGDVISTADKALVAKEYQKALTGYQSALKLKPGEQYPKNKISEIEEAKAEIARQEEILKKFNEAVAFGDKNFNLKNYDNAIYEYQVANSLKPDNPYPLQKISEIEALKEAIRKQTEIDNQYNKIIATADEYLKKEQFEEARASYQEALKIKPAEDFPGKQIIEINRTLETLATQRDQAYQLAISKADNYFNQQDYEMAKLQLDRALELKPNELYPLDKLKLVNEQIMKKRQLIQEEYDKGIADADKFYASKIYDNAIESYRASSVLKPEEEYPKEMVRRILKLLTERSIVQINKDPLLITNNTQHKFDFIPVPVKDRKSNYIFFKARNVSKVDYKLIISFGKDQTKNGGVVIKVPPGEDIYEFVVRISAQYKWFSDDNNWITFYPEGGDFEVSLMQISYSD